MECPKCDHARLGPVGRHLRGTTWLTRPAHCPGCGGMWLELNQIPEAVTDLDPLESGSFAETNRADRRAGICPHGHGLLTRAPVLQGEEFYLDRCLTCQGIWFDAGEWQRLAERSLLEDLPQIWTDGWQRGQRTKRLEASYLNWAKDEFGVELLAKLDELAALLTDSRVRSEALAYLKDRSLE